MRFISTLLIALLLAPPAMQAQQLMPTVHDACRIDEQKQRFVNQPLHVLLKEIGPEIKLVFVDGNRADGALSYIIFRFVDREGSRAYVRAGKTPLGIRVMIKEHFEWNKTGPDAEKWTKEDAELLSNLTIAYVQVYGDVIDPTTETP